MAKDHPSGNTVFKRFRDWVKADVSKHMFDAVSDDPDVECAMSAKPKIFAVYATVVKPRKSLCSPKRCAFAAGFAVSAMVKSQRGTESQAIGRSRGGPTAKIVALTDALGNLVRFALLPRGNAKRLPPGQRHDTVGAAPLIQGVEFYALLRSSAPSGSAGKAFDANWTVDELDERGAKIVIPQMPQRKATLDIDREVHRWRHLIENFFCKLKEFKRIVMRSDKTDASFGAMIHLASAVINSRQPVLNRP